MSRFAPYAVATLLAAALPLPTHADPILSSGGSPAGGSTPFVTTIVNQPANTSLLPRVSQVFPDAPTFSAFEFDDFQTSVPYNLSTLTVFGEESVTPPGNPALNTAVTAQIWSGLPGSGVVVLSASGTEVGNNLQFNFNGALLPAGNWWLTAFVTRVFTPGGQWFWRENLPVTGSQSFFYNPGGGFGLGTAPVPGSTVFGTAANQAFVLQGDQVAVVPEPSSLLLFALAGGAALLARRWSRHCRRTPWASGRS